MDNQIKGYNYEIQIRDYIITELNKQAYLWSHTPESILIDYNIIGCHNDARLKRKENKENPLIDTGVDIIQVENDSLSLVQCKNGYKNGVTINDLAGFNFWMANTNFRGYVYYTNKLSNNILYAPKSERIEYILKPYIKPIIPSNEIIKITPYQYQIDASNKIDESFYRGILTLPCGCGKTFTSYLISKKYKQVIIISPLRQFAKQNLDRYIEYGYKYNTLLVDSDSEGTRDKKYIKNFIKDNNNFLISSTFDSVDVIYSCSKYMTDPLFIIDEFHNISKNNIIDEDDDFYKLLNSDHKILFMSATPRVYEMEDEPEDFEQENLFGDIVYKMSFNEAIDNNYITDYKIWLPSIHEDNTELLNELSIYDIDSEIKSKCMFLYINLLKHGSRKCIIYCKNKKEVNNMMLTMDTLNKYYLIDYEQNKITSDTSANNRTDILNKFQSSNKIYLLFSVRILDECIDIPACDSIYIANPPSSKIRTIQRLCRCIRKDKNNPNKIGNIFIWCNEYESILETLSGLKEYDELFKDKINLIENNFYGKSDNKILLSDKKLINNYLIGIKEFKQLSWTDRLEQVKKYIDEHKKRPPRNDPTDNVKYYNGWIRHQSENYKKTKHIMKNINIRNLWQNFMNKYKDYFKSRQDIWFEKLNQSKKYIDEYKMRPTEKDKLPENQSLSVWISTQVQNYAKNNKIMKNINVKTAWEQFVIEYKHCFLTNEEEWTYMLNKVRMYIDKNKIRPHEKSEINEISTMGHWLSKNINTYPKKKEIMKYSHIRILWEKFVDEYKNLFMSIEEKWIFKLANIKKHINENKKISDKNIKKWLSRQKSNYIKKIDIMKKQHIRNLYENFISEYKEYL